MKDGSEPIKSIMTRNVIVIDIEQELIVALDIMEKGVFNHLPVVKGDQLVGMLSMTDIKRIKYLSEFANDNITARTTFQIFDTREVMTENPITVDEELSIREVARLFSTANHHAMPVLNNGHMVGIVSVKDILAYYVQ